MRRRQMENGAILKALSSLENANIFLESTVYYVGGQVAQLVEQLATDWKVRGSIPGSDRIFSRCLTFRTAPRFTQPPIKLSTGSFPEVKGGQSVVPTTPPHSSAEVILASSTGDLSIEAAQLERAIRTNDTLRVKRFLDLHHDKFQYNTSKTKVLTNDAERQMIVNNANIEFVTQYIYLGQTISFQSSIGKDIDRRIASAWRKFWSLSFILMDKSQKLQDNRQIFNSCIAPVLLYGAQSWSLTKK
ncbi:hypothetical protein ANN_18276 [Periplaneta americana]|uniref:Uncharacterized protein n=1 Tax=Periplaneta americana TaxID=6978 RepID=A0ABQ8SQE2_PERAM|nr:hypothetical protein ANN_18276 [Periplaneta americana]